MPEPTVLLDGLGMGESPRWHAGRLWLADWGGREVVAVDLEGRREVMARLPSAPFSIDWLPDGRLLVIAGREAQLLRAEHDETRDATLDVEADLGHLARTPWNEIVVDGRANIYLNNIGFEFPGGAFAPGTVALLTADGAARQVAGGLAFPNGMAVTPDNTTLLVAESYAECLTAFDIGADGSLANQRLWANTPGDHPDGICLDAEGAAWYADVGTRRCVRVREGGAVLDEVRLELGAFACALGGPDLQTLFIVAADWSDPAALFAGRSRTGVVLAVPAPAARAGWP
jgi:sugar lactone lactonase YvrE